ncbi:MAG TPA: hypothetical protein VHC19_06520 [Pirellulales bacterium]|jgi:hypothetical protein|nr:hypothetical protein [Pirellulales bacterium]
MKRVLHKCCLAAAAMVTALSVANLAFAQIESLNPNPTQPSGVGSGPVGGPYGYGRTGGGQMGIGLGPKASGGNENPAETLLREMFRSQFKGPTGNVRFHGNEVRAARKFDTKLSGMPALEGGAVYFGERGAYEDSLYRPRRGTYRKSARVAGAQLQPVRTQTARPVMPRGN